MEIRQLENHIRTLIELDETESPVVSYFLDLEDPDGSRLIRNQIITARKALDPNQRPAFNRTIDRIEDHVPWKLDETTRSVAVFARSGSNPLFLVMEFEATLPTRLSVDSLPSVFPLIELKDNYHRYVLMICNDESARIMEVSLGSVTREVWTRRPELRERVGREWTRLHYQNHRRDRTDRFVKEKISMVERVMASGGHTHLMLAGSAQMLARVRKALPRSLQRKLVDTIPAAARDQAADIVVATLSTFIEHEERESLESVSLLRQELRRGELAVCGHRDSREALERGQADQLIILADPDQSDGEWREELVRLAVQQGVHVEVVQSSDELEQMGGVGALLRYRNWTEPVAGVGHAA